MSASSAAGDPEYVLDEKWSKCVRAAQTTCAGCSGSIKFNYEQVTTATLMTALINLINLQLRKVTFVIGKSVVKAKIIRTTLQGRRRMDEACASCNSVFSLSDRGRETPSV